MSTKAVQKEPYLLHSTPGYLKTQEMCDEKAVREDPYRLQYFPDPLTTHEMRIKVVAENPWNKQCPSLVCQAKASKSVAA